MTGYGPTVVASELTIKATDGTEISINVHSAGGKALLLWLPSEHGPQTVASQLIAELTKSGMEVWQIDPFETNFLPVSFSSMEKIPAEQISSLIQAAHKRTGKTIYIYSTGRGAIPVLRGARHWQQQNPESTALAGVILLSPIMSVETPDPGLEEQFMPVVTATNLPVFILQPDLSPWFWKLERSVSALQQGGSDVYVRRLKDVRARFHFRPDATRFEQQFTNKIPELIIQSVLQLAHLPNKPRDAVALAKPAPKPRVGKKERSLKEYKGDSNPPALKLKNLKDKMVDLKSLHGQVVLVNFWATWCPPCVHEMPSMQRLTNKLKSKPFTILAVNMAEEKSTIQNFINTKVKVNFPIVMDKDGTALRNWKVFAFPTSYLIDKKGQIRFALFGSIEWDTPDIINKIEMLVKEPD